MSKSLNIFLPAISGTVLCLGLAYGLASRDYGSEKITSLESRVERVSARASEASAKAEAEATRAAELEAKIAEVQAAATAGATLTAPAPAADGSYGLGRAALPVEIAAWDVDVLPDGRGLPEGSGDVFTGEEVFAEKCAACHGDFAEGVDNWPVLAGGFDTLADKDPVKTVGSYWPYLSTAFDYISRSMPFGEAGTLTPDETYAIVAYILYSNDLVDDEFELNHENFSDFDMYNMEGFVIDDRETLEYALWRAEPCMQNCKEQVEVTMRSTFVDVTPEDGGESVMNHGAATELPKFTAAGPSFVPEAAPAPAAATPPAPAPEDQPAAADSGADLAAAGEKVFGKCKACHQVGASAKNRTGPVLNGIVGAPVAQVEKFKYSKNMAALGADGGVWDEATLNAFLENPKAYVKGTKMSFAGLKSEDDRQAIIAYLKSFE